jgi:pectin methylesterase-like acyl-CoA thioesterase
MGKLKMIAYPTGNGQFIYVPKKAIDGISKKAIILKQYTVVGSGESTELVFITKAPKVISEPVEHDRRGRLVIEYESKNGSGHGVIELYDMGPDIPKTKKNNESEEL